MSDKSYKQGDKPSPETPPRPPIESGNNLINTQSHMRGEIKPKRGGKRPGAGRKKGVKNKKTLLFEAMTDFQKVAAKNAPAVFEALAEEAKKGESWAVKLFIDKIVPNAQPEGDKKIGNFGIQIVINDMKEAVIEGEVIDDS
jgi:hypothetical protein